MSAVDGTLQKVSDQFLSESLADLQEARARSLAKVAEGRKAADEGISKVLDLAQKRAESLQRQIVGTAELEARNAQLKALEAAVAEVFDSAAKKLGALAPGKYEKALVRLISEGVEVIGPSAKVSCSSKDRKLVSSVVKGMSKGKVKLALDDKTIETIGGVSLTTPDGTISFDNTFEARLERLRLTLRKEVAQVLTSA